LRNVKRGGSRASTGPVKLIWRAHKPKLRKRGNMDRLELGGLGAKRIYWKKAGRRGRDRCSGIGGRSGFS